MIEYQQVSIKKVVGGNANTAHNWRSFGRKAANMLLDEGGDTDVTYVTYKANQLFSANIPISCYQYLHFVAPAWLEIRRVLRTRAGSEVVTALVLPRATKMKP